MSTYTPITEKAQGQNQTETSESDTEPSLEQPLHATVELEVQAKVDTNHPDSHRRQNGDQQDFTGQTLAQEERIKAREQELTHIRERAHTSRQKDRAARSRRRAHRRCSDDRTAPTDPREVLTQDQLATVNQEAERLAGRYEDGPNRAAIARRLAEQVQESGDVTTAVLHTVEAIRDHAGTIVPIGELEATTGEVSVEGELRTLWNSDHPKIQQVGLLADETGTTKLTVWKKSKQPLINEGERVRVRQAATSWHEGRIHIAATGWSRFEFPER